MKFRTLAMMAFSLLIAACTQGPSNAAEDTLIVSIGENEFAYTVDDLKALPSAVASFREVEFVGVPLAKLLEGAGLTLGEISAVKAVAVDGFSANYEPWLALKEDTLVAYGRADGPLIADEAPLRMVLPDQEGKLNVRQLVEIQVIP